MPLVACGSVIESTPNRSVIQVERERCSQCPGHCVRFKSSGKLTVAESIPVGGSVQVKCSASGLAIVSSVVFGLLPLVLTVSVTLNQTQSAQLLIAIVVGTLAVSALTARVLVRRLLKVVVSTV